MADTQKLFTSRIKSLNADEYIGQAGRLFYDEPATPGVSPILRYSDGETVGGIPLTGAGGAGVSSITAGAGISINHSTGNVTITATGGSGGNLGNLVINGTDLQTISGTQTNTDIVLNPNGTGWVSVPKLKIPVGSLVQGSLAIINVIDPLLLDQVIAYSNGDFLPANTYGDNPQVPAPWIVYKFITIPSPILQVDDFLAGLGIPVDPPCTVRWVGSGDYAKYVIVDNHTYTGYPTLAIPKYNSTIYVTRATTHQALNISTVTDTDIVLQVGSGGSLVTDCSIIPYIENIYDLGSPVRRYKDLWLGNSIYLLDQTLKTHWQIHADQGILNLLGGTGVRVGEFNLNENILKIEDSTRDIKIGTLLDTGSVVFNRAVKIQTISGVETFSVSRDGTTTISVPTNLGPTVSAFSIIGPSSGIQQPRNFNNTLLQATAQDGAPARICLDSFGTNTYGLLVARTARGTVDSPAQSKANDTLLRLSGSGWGITNVIISNYSSTGYVSKISAGGTAYDVTFNIPQQNTQPQLTSDVTGTTYEVRDNSNHLYNLTGLQCVASSTTSITLRYPTNPGTFDLVPTLIESTGFFLGAISRINLIAAEDFTTSSAGTKILFQTTPIGSTTISTSAIIDDTGLVLAGATNSSSGITFKDGTRQTTAAILPSQNNNANKFLKTDGATATWQSIPTGITYKGLWNASLNSPTLIDGTGTGGDEYSVIVGATRNLGSGDITFAQGDFVIYNATSASWERIPGSATGITSITIDGSTYSSSDVTITSNDIISAINTGSITNNKLEYDNITINTGTGLSGGGSVALSNGSSVLNLANTGVVAINVSDGITKDYSTGTVTIGSTATVLSTANTIALRDSNGGLNAADFTATRDTSVSTNHGPFNVSNLSYSDNGILASFSSSEIYYNQLIIQNTRNTISASANILVSNNIGTASTYYGEFGMNSSAWIGTGFNLANAVYLNSQSSELIIGTVAEKSVKILTNNTEAISIASTGVATFAQTISGSITGNAGTANSVNHSLTAGTGITFNTGSTYNGSAAITINATQYTLPASNTTTLGGVIIPAVGTSAIYNNSGTIGVSTASSTQLGAIKIGAGLNIDGNGVVTTSGIQASVRQAGTISSLTIDFSTDDVVQCTASGALSIGLQNYVAGKIVRVMILQPAKNNITHGLQATNVNVGNVVLASTEQANTPNTVFITYTCVAASQAGTYAQIIY